MDLKRHNTHLIPLLFCDYNHWFRIPNVRNALTLNVSDIEEDSRGYSCVYSVQQCIKRSNNPILYIHLKRSSWMRHEWDPKILNMLLWPPMVTTLQWEIHSRVMWEITCIQNSPESFISMGMPCIGNTGAVWFIGTLFLSLLKKSNRLYHSKQNSVFLISLRSYPKRNGDNIPYACYKVYHFENWLPGIFHLISSHHDLY